MIMSLACFLYSPGHRELGFSETGLPVYDILGNSVAVKVFAGTIAWGRAMPDNVGLVGNGHCFEEDTQLATTDRKAFSMGCRYYRDPDNTVGGN